MSADPRRTEPAVAEDRSPAPSLPVGIPQFAGVKDRITSGLKPSLDGLEWLKANGYRNVIHLRGLRDGNGTDRKVLESYGLKYHSMDVVPETLGQALDEFNRLVGDQAMQPLFVYDRDGMLSGAVWYLHFRTVERMTDEAARRRAGALGLREDTSGDAATLWVAINEYLRKNLR